MGLANLVMVLMAPYPPTKTHRLQPVAWDLGAPLLQSPQEIITLVQFLTMVQFPVGDLIIMANSVMAIMAPRPMNTFRLRQVVLEQTEQQ